MAIVSSGNNQFNPSSLVSKTVMGLLKAKPTLAKFANSTHNGIFSDKVKAYAPGTTYTMNIPTYPQVQYGSEVDPTGKQIRTATININTGNNANISGYINCVREVDQTVQQLYLQDKDEWNRQFVKPTFEVLRGQINTVLQRQLGNSAAYTILPRYTNDGGVGNEGSGRFFRGDITMFPRALDYQSAMNMNDPEDWVWCMSSSAYYDMVSALMGQYPAALPTGIPSRFVNKVNEKAVEDGVLTKICGLYFYHTSYIPYHFSGTNSYSSTNPSAYPTPGTNYTFSNNDGTAIPAILIPEAFKCIGFNGSTGSTPPTPSLNTTKIVVTGLTPIPETVGYLMLSVTAAAIQTGNLILQFNPRDTLVLSPRDKTNNIQLTAVDPITKDPRGESFTCNVACATPFTVEIKLLAIADVATFYIPVNFLPYGPDPITVVGSLSKTNELQAIGLKGNVKQSIYNAVATNGDITFKTGLATSNATNLRQLGNHTKIYGFSKNGLNFVNPPLSDIVGADNEQVYDNEARMSILTTIQGGILKGTNIMRTSSLWGTGGITDAIVQIPYYPGY